MDRFIGTWKLVNSKHLEEFMQAMGIQDELRKLGHVVKPILAISQDGDTVVFEIQTVVGDQTSTFKLGEEVDRKTADGKDCKVTVSLDGEKITELTKWNDSQSSYVYEIKHGHLIKTLTYKDVVAVQTYIRE